MIRYENAVALLWERIPGYVDSAEAGRVDEEDGPYLHVLYAVIYAHRRLYQGDDLPLVALLALAEEFMVDGERDVQNLGDVGIIEDLTNANLWMEGLSARTLLGYLGPRARNMPTGVELAMQADDGFVQTDARQSTEWADQYPPG